MAFWGEALTYSHLLWGEDDPVAARAALARLAPTPAERLARAGTPRERAFGAAVESLFVDGRSAGSRARLCRRDAPGVRPSTPTTPTPPR